MRLVRIEEIRRAVSPAAAIRAMRDAVFAHARAEDLYIGEACLEGLERAP